MDALEYSYSTETGARDRRELAGRQPTRAAACRAGILLDHQAPAEEGRPRSTRCGTGTSQSARAALELRAGHFYGMFGRGLLFAAREDRTLRVDTALDGLLIRRTARRWRAARRSPARPRALSVDVARPRREADLRRRLVAGRLRPDLAPADGLVRPTAPCTASGWRPRG